MLRLALYTVCIVLSLQGSLVASQDHPVCVLRDAPTQCGSFCLSALHPLFADTDNIRSRLDGIEAGLDSCKMKNDYEARLAGIENHLKASQLKISEDLIKTKDDLINAQKKLIDKDDQITDLKNWIETSKLNQSNELSECRLKLDEMEPFKVSCSSSPHGWTVIQRRIDGSENFHRNWDDYKKGFGNVKGEFFIGLENLHQMTKAGHHELYIKLGKVDGSTSYAHYDDFKIGSEDELYELKSIGIYSGEAGDSLKFNKNKKFSTFDRDNDEWYANLADLENGGWWHGVWEISQLNGKYYKDGQITNKGIRNGIYWISWHNYDVKISLTYVEMMIRPKSL
ncbi:fibrinogen-like protein 1 [Drosophila elegans]|uniref:fibrinogen-like protein 1 n=1 Tax=Drosophila elegans TaxID=30023 RepID=UPI001BC85CC5|nr:fibrinogen-like protein 1 [Drosophila elegans]